MNTILAGGLLAAGMLLGQTNNTPQYGPVIQAQAAQQPSRPILGWFSREDRPIISKIQSWFKREPREPQKDGPFIQPAKRTKTSEPPLAIPQPQPANDFFRKLPNPSSKANTPRQLDAAALQQAANLNNVKTPIRPQFVNKIGRDERFEWITGQLEIENGSYVLYYATPNTVDKFNGRIVLAPQKVEMKGLRSGDLVSVHGQLGQIQTRQGATPIYRLTTASKLERP